IKNCQTGTHVIIGDPLDADPAIDGEGWHRPDTLICWPRDPNIAVALDAHNLNAISRIEGLAAAICAIGAAALRDHPWVSGIRRAKQGARAGEGGRHGAEIERP